MTITHAMQFGTLEVGTYANGWRFDIYINAEGERFRERTMPANSSDTSARFDRMNNYDSQCSCCWLNITHTVARHEKSVANAI